MRTRIIADTYGDTVTVNPGAGEVNMDVDRTSFGFEANIPMRLSIDQSRALRKALKRAERELSQ